MPAGLPNDSAANNTGANPSAGNPVLFDLLSGPKGSPFDKDPSGKASTGALSTGIGYGQKMGPVANKQGVGMPTTLRQYGWIDDYTLGQSKVDATATTNSTYMYIGGGKSTSTGSDTRGRPFPPNPYTAGYGVGGAGNGGSRDAGAGPTVFTGFLIKMVTTAASIANGAAIESGWINRSGATIPGVQSTFGSSNVASATPA